MALVFTAAAFSENAELPVKFTCLGTNVSPAFSIRERQTVPDVIAPIIEDPDAPSGTFAHRIIFLNAGCHKITAGRRFAPRPASPGVRLGEKPRVHGGAFRALPAAR